MNDLSLFEPVEFEKLISDALNPHSQTQKESEQKLLVLKSNPNSLHLVDLILTKCLSKPSHFFALQILEENIKHRWTFLNKETQSSFFIYLIQKTSIQSVLLPKLNECLVNILKLEYPNNFSTFISDIVNESLSNENICNNAFDLLNLFNFEMRQNLPSFRKKQIVSNFRNEFYIVYNLVSNSLGSEKCLNALKGFLVFFSVEHLANCDLIENLLVLVNSVFSLQVIDVLKSIFEKINDLNKGFCEECSKKDGSEDKSSNRRQNNSKGGFGLASVLYPNVNACVSCVYLKISQNHFLLSPSFKYTMLTSDDILQLPSLRPKLFAVHSTCINFIEMYFQKFKESGSKLENQYLFLDMKERDFIRSISKLLVEFYETNMFVNKDSVDDMKKGLIFLLKIAKVEDHNLLRLVIEFFNKITLINTNENFNRDFSHGSAVSQAKSSGSFSNQIQAQNAFSNHFQNALSPSIVENSYFGAFLNHFDNVFQSLIELLIKKMPRPEDVYVTRNEFGEIVKQRITDTDQLEFIKLMQSTLQNCAKLQYDYVVCSLSSKISTISTKSDSWSHDILNRICWSAGAISAQMTDNNFFTTALKHLLSMCEKNSSKNDKAIIASNILFLVSSFDSFLNKNEKFLKTVVKKLFEFMEETHEGVMEMSCELYLKISEKTKVHCLFEKHESFLKYIMGNLLIREASKLPIGLKMIVYKALFWSISKINESKIGIVENLLSIIHSDFEKVVQKEKGTNHIQYQNADAFIDVILQNRKVCLTFSSIIKSYTDLFQIIPECAKHTPFLNLHFKIYNSLIDKKYEQANLLISNLLNLITTAIESVEPSREVCDYIFANVLIHCGFKNLPNYYNLSEKMIENIKIRDRFVETCETNRNSHINNIFDANRSNSSFKTFDSPIQSNMGSFDEQYILLRDSFMIDSIIQPTILTDSLELFTLLKTALYKSNNFFNILFNRKALFKQIITILLENISNITKAILSYEILIIIIHNALTNNCFMFFNEFFTSIYETVLAASLDKENNASLEYQAGLLKLLLCCINKIPVMNENISKNLDGNAFLNTQNELFIRKYTLDLFKSNFSHIKDDSILLFIDGLMALKENHFVLRDHIIDFRFKVENMFLLNNLVEERNILNERIQMIQEIFANI